ncbi:MAG: hypothetical protein AAFP90_08570 [Planctomycetota bacterium]
MSNTNDSTLFSQLRDQLQAGVDTAGTEQEEAFVEKVMPRVQSFVRRRITTAVRKAFDSADITGTVMRRFVQSYRKGNIHLSTEGEFMSMLDVMTQRAIIEKHDFLCREIRDHSRTQSLDVAGEDGSRFDPTGEEDCRSNLIGNVDLSPVDAAELAEKLEGLNTMLDSIRESLKDPVDWYLLRRRVVEEASWKTIAGEIGTTADAARVRLTRVLKKLRDRFCEDD